MVVGRIYKINDINDLSKSYTGSTYKTLALRLLQHKTTSRIKPHIKLYQYFNNIGWERAGIELIENYQHRTIEQLRKRERYHKDLLNSSLNMINSYRTPAEKKEQERKADLKRNQTQKRKDYQHNRYIRLKREARKQLRAQKMQMLQDMRKEMIGLNCEINQVITS